MNEVLETRTSINGKDITVHHVLQLTMIDGKIHTYISDATNSMHVCSIYGASPKEM